MGKRLKWDVPMLDGYKYKFLYNWSPMDTPNRFLGLFNPGIMKELILDRYDAVIIHVYSALSYLLSCLGAWISRTPAIISSVDG